MSGSTLAYSTTTGQQRAPKRRDEVALGGVTIELLFDNSQVRIGDVVLAVTYLDDDPFDGYVARFEIACTHEGEGHENTTTHEFTLYDDRVSVVDKVSLYEGDRPSFFDADERELHTMRAVLHYIQTKVCECRRATTA